MSRRLYAPTASIGTVANVVAVANGGTGATDATGAATNLGAIGSNKLGVAGGVAALDGSGKLPTNSFPAGALGAPTIVGSTSISASTVNTYNITNYDNSTTYTLSAVGGSVSRSADVITYTAPSSVGTSGFVLNGRTFGITITAALPNAPTITSPVQGANGLGYSNSATTSVFSITGTTDTHYSSDWQIATDNGFTAVVLSATDDTVNKVSWAFSGLTPATTYYMRCRHKGASAGYGAWSTSISFTIKLS